MDIIVRFDDDRDERFASFSDPNRTYFAVGDIGAHEGHVTSRVTADAWTQANPDGWTEQDVAGAHGRILYQGPCHGEAWAVFVEWEQCDARAKGAYCYAHNPGLQVPS